jgi:membrane protease YdiL (CAAX protease family)
MKMKKISRQRDIELMLFVIIASVVALELFGVVSSEYGVYKTILCESGVYLLFALPSVLAYKLQGKHLRDVIAVKKIGLRPLLLLLLLRVAITVLFDISGIEHPGLNPYGFWKLLAFAAHYIFIVAVCEEFIFRIYVQETFIDWFGKYAFLAPLFSGILFGLSHTVNCLWRTVLFNCVIGVIWGYAHYYDKKCTYLTLVLVHGLSDCIPTIYSLIKYFYLFNPSYFSFN